MSARHSSSGRSLTLTLVAAFFVSLISAGSITARDAIDNAGPGLLAARVIAGGGTAPLVRNAGESVPVSGALFRATADALVPTAARFSLQVILPDGRVHATFGPYSAAADGSFAVTLPESATAGIQARSDSNFRTTVAIQVVDAAFVSPATLDWSAAIPAAAPLTVVTPPTGLIVHNSFVSDVGWVKPGAAYPFRVFVKNYASTAALGATVEIPAASGMTFTRAIPQAGAGTAAVSPMQITWTVGDVPAATSAGPTIRTLVAEARAKATTADPRVVWKDLSTTATLNYTGAPAPVTSKSRGPKVIPERETFDTARYGDRPFPVVPVDWFDRKHQAAHTGQALSDKINSPDVVGSTFNLYQEMSYGQLFPDGTVPSASIATAGWDVQWKSPRYQASGFEFTAISIQGACTGLTHKDEAGQATYSQRINGGWYQMPGDTNYYGADRFTFGGALVLGGGGIDNACGPIGKAVYDAAHIADPEIDYSDYDTDKDGVVDFFMMVFVGEGGNGVSQTSVPPYDNIWPHSTSLEFYYTDPATGLTGYISDDQLRDYEDRPLYYTDASRTAMTPTVTAFPVYVRVGPYNVNPESAIDQASVISHEYGHSLGLPDFYSATAQVRTTYGDWNLMATDKSQHMDVFGKQELGWLIPREVAAGTTTVSGWRDSKVDTHRIDWVQPDGTPYTLSGPDVHNGEAYVAKLPPRRVLDPDKVARGASADSVWWSGSGDMFGCNPTGGHNLDFFLPELANLAPGTVVKLTFKSMWDIEWDFDYGFVLVTTDGGQSYRSLRSERGFSTGKDFNPNQVACLEAHDNGLTGTTAAFVTNTQTTDRVAGIYRDSEFVEDSYDLSFAVGSLTALRFSYSTDPAVARPAWFIDDVKVTANGAVIYQSNFESGPDEDRIFNGGCQGTAQTAPQCTDGWTHVDTGSDSAADHAYYLEMRDRSGFDFDGHGQNDRAAIGFQPGLLLVYTDEAHGYGNVGTPDPPAQTPLDSQPDPTGVALAGRPNLNDAAFTAAGGDNRFSDSGQGWRDNYSDPDSEDRHWYFRHDCLTFQVQSMSGNTDNSAAAFDLRGDVRFTRGAGCYPFDRGHITPANVPPTAVIQVKPASGDANTHFHFDGSRSFDDTSAPNELRFDWDLDGDGKFDATGSHVKHNYQVAGTYNVLLQVTDKHGATGTATRTITVRHP